MMRRLLWPALTTGVMLSLTLSLGVWQLQRLSWKQGLLAEVDRSEQSPPSALTGAPAAFRRVTLTGHYLPDVARYGVEVRSTMTGAVLGSQVLSPIQVDAGPPVVVDRGWAPEGEQSAPPAGVVTVEGYVRPAEYPIRFGAADDPAHRRFYALDPVAIGASLGLPQVAPFTVVLLGKPGGFPEPATALPRPPNDHLSYALTWFGLSGALVLIFLVYAGQGPRAAKP